MNKVMKNQESERTFLMQNLQVNAFSDVSRMITEKLAKISKKHSK